MEIYFVIELVKLVLPVCKAEIKNIYQQRKKNKTTSLHEECGCSPNDCFLFFPLFCCECFLIRLKPIDSSAIFDISCKVNKQ